MGKGSALVATLLALTACVAHTDAQIVVRLAHDSEAERATREQLLRLVEEHDVEPWLYTREVLIDQTQIPHSHPVLTLHTRHLGEDMNLLATFVHEQFHWLEAGETLGAFRDAMSDFRELYPAVPDRAGGGASDDESTWRHLVVCDLEFQAMTVLVGERTAREVLAGTTHYQWIYDRVLNDPRVREVNRRHGFVID